MLLTLPGEFWRGWPQLASPPWKRASGCLLSRARIPDSHNLGSSPAPSPKGSCAEIKRPAGSSWRRSPPGARRESWRKVEAGAASGELRGSCGHGLNGASISRFHQPRRRRIFSRRRSAPFCFLPCWSSSSSSLPAPGYLPLSQTAGSVPPPT